MIIITIKDSLYFVYDGISSQDMGIINVNIDSGLQSEPFYPSASILEISTRYNETPYFQKIKREPLVFNLTFAFEDGFDDDKLRETARWLNQKTFKELYFSNQPDKKYFAIYEGSPRLFHTGADGYFEITFRTNSPYAHSNLIETGIYNQVSPTFTFTRPSPAYHPDTGEEIPADTPIYVDFAAGKKGSLMVEGTENLIAEANSKERIIEAGSSNTAHWGCYYWMEKSTTYTISFEAEFLEGQSDYITVYPYLATGQALSPIHIPYSAGIRMSTTFTTDDEYNYHLLIYAGRSGQTAGNTVKFTNMQLEAKPYATPWHIGGSTRANPVKRITLPEALPEEFGVGVRFKPLWDSETYDLMDYRIIFTMGSDIAANIVRVMRYTYNRWDLRVYADGVGAVTLFERSFNAGEIIGFYIVKKGTRAKVFYAQEGESYESDWFSVGETFTDEKVKNIFIGSSYGGAIRHAGGVIADFVLHDRPEDIDPEGYLSQVPGGGV